MPRLFTHRTLLASAALLTTSFIAYRYYRPSPSRKSSQNSLQNALPASRANSPKPAIPSTEQQSSLPSFGPHAPPPPGSYTLTLATALHCNDCISSVTSALGSLQGIHSVSCSFESQLVTVVGSAPPSAVIKKIQDTGRAAVLRGSGRMGDGGAGVCILEIPVGKERRREGMSGEKESPICGLIRFIQLEKAEGGNTQQSSSQDTETTKTLLDITLTGVPEGDYSIKLHTTGDVSSPPSSLGPPINASSAATTGKAGTLGALTINRSGRGELVSEINWPVWEMVGRGISVQRMTTDDTGSDQVHKVEEEEGLVVGVVARSAGVWENEKMVCGCSGKTVWEEREEMVSKGIT